MQQSRPSENCSIFKNLCAKISKQKMLQEQAYGAARSSSKLAITNRVDSIGQLAGSRVLASSSSSGTSQSTTLYYRTSQQQCLLLATRVTGSSSSSSRVLATTSSLLQSTVFQNSVLSSANSFYSATDGLMTISTNARRTAFSTRLKSSTEIKTIILLPVPVVYCTRYQYLVVYYQVPTYQSSTRYHSGVVEHLEGFNDSSPFCSLSKNVALPPKSMAPCCVYYQVPGTTRPTTPNKTCYQLAYRQVK